MQTPEPSAVATRNADAAAITAHHEVLTSGGGAFGGVGDGWGSDTRAGVARFAGDASVASRAAIFGVGLKVTASVWYDSAEVRGCSGVWA